MYTILLGCQIEGIYLLFVTNALLLLNIICIYCQRIHNINFYQYFIQLKYKLKCWYINVANTTLMDLK